MSKRKRQPKRLDPTDFGLTPRQVEQCQEIAEIPEEIQNEYCAQAEEITRDGLIEFAKRRMKPKQRRSKTNLASLSQQLRNDGWEPGLTDDSYERIIAAGFNGKNLPLASVAAEIACNEQPITLRGLFYRVVSAGWLPSTDQKHYNRLGRLLTKLREARIVPFNWIVDNLRSTEKPSSWSGLSDFVETVRNAYRLDFWAGLPEYVHVFCEKDAIAGVLSPVTREFDVRLSPIRGYCSLSFAHEIADLWNSIDKPIYAAYLGDFDPSGFDLERDVRAKLTKYCDRSFQWVRLGLLHHDFREFDLIPLEPKKSDRRCAAFIRQHGEQCAELDALPPTELRRRVREFVESFIPQDEWARLQTVELAERESFSKFLERASA